MYNTHTGTAKDLSPASRDLFVSQGMVRKIENLEHFVSTQNFERTIFACTLGADRSVVAADLLGGQILEGGIKRYSELLSSVLKLPPENERTSEEKLLETELKLLTEYILSFNDFVLLLSDWEIQTYANAIFYLEEVCVSEIIQLDFWKYWVVIQTTLEKSMDHPNPED